MPVLKGGDITRDAATIVDILLICVLIWDMAVTQRLYRIYRRQNEIIKEMSGYLAEQNKELMKIFDELFSMEGE